MTERRPSHTPTPSATTAAPSASSSESIGTAASLGGAAQHVPDAADGFEQRRILRIVLDFGTQPVHVDVDSSGLTGVVVAPHVREKLLPREHLALVAEQERQQIERLGLDRPDLRTMEQSVTGEIDRRTPDGDELGLLARRRCPRSLAPPQEAANACLQLAQAERFGDVVVSPQLESDDLV